MIITKELKQAHEKVKAHPFRLNKTDWKGYYKLLQKVDKALCSVLKEEFKGSKNFSWGFFIHELRGAIWHFQFEFNIDKFQKELGRIDLENKEYKGEEYGKIIPKYQSQIIIILENYIQQIHKIIITGNFEKFITYYLGGEKCMEEIQSNGKSRWNKYELNKKTNEFKFVGKLK